MTRRRIELTLLTADACWRLLRRHHLGRLGFVVAARPTILPVNYVMDGQTIVFRASPGSRLAAAARGQHVAFEIDEANETLECGASVVVQGLLRRVMDPLEIARLNRLPLRTWAPGERDELLCVVPTSITGRRIDPPSGSDGLAADAG